MQVPKIPDALTFGFLNIGLLNYYDQEKINFFHPISLKLPNHSPQEFSACDELLSRTQNTYKLNFPFFSPHKNTSVSPMHMKCPTPRQSHVSVDIRDSPVEGQHEVDRGPNFSISQEKLAELVQINDVVSLEQAGGILQIAAALETDIDTGIVGDERDLGRRLGAFGLNVELEGQDNPMRKSFRELVLEAFKDSTIILLLCCATLSLLIGIKTNGPQEGFTDGAIVFFAIFVVVNFGLVSRFLKTRLILRKFQKHKRVVSVVRRRKMQEIPVSGLVVGDVVFLEAGNQVPADGLFIHGDSFKLDDGVVERGTKCPFMFRGAKVVEGNCRMLVTAVGKKTERSKLIGAVLKTHDEEPKLQAAIDRMNSRLEKLWLILSLFILSVQVLRCFGEKSASDESHNPDPKSTKNTVEEIMNESAKLMKKQGGKVNGLVSVLCILLFAARDGSALGVLILCFCTSRKMKSFGAKIQKLPACSTIGLVTSICLGKTNALTLQHSEMAELWIGLNRIMDVPKEVNIRVLKIFLEGIGVNSSGQTKDSLFFWAKKVLGLDMDAELCRNATILYNELLDVNRNCCVSILTRSEEANQVLMLHCMGAPNSILSLCSHYYDVDGTVQILDEEKRDLFNRLIEDIESNSLQCFSLAYKQVIREESKSQKLEGKKGNVHRDDEETLNFIYHGFALVGLVRLKNPYAPGVKEALAAFRDLGINVKLVVDDDVNTARIMALNSGILRPGEDEEVAVVEASHFRNSSVEGRMNMIGNIQVMASASPSDKLLMVQCLRKKEEVVAITSSCIRDCPSLVEADVGIFMDNHNAEVAKEDADIILGQNIGTIASILRSGRYVCKNIEIFLQLHLTLNVSAFAINFILEVFANEVQLITSLHLLWTNLIVESLGAFALAVLVDPGESTSPPPIYGSGPIITKIMWRDITVQSLFQVTILLVLAMKGKYILGVDENVLGTMIFNSYVLCQVFVLITGAMQRASSFRRRAIHENYLFAIVVVLIVSLQVMLVEIMRFVSHWRKLDFKKWLICFGIAAISVPVGYVAEWVSVTMQVV